MNGIPVLIAVSKSRGMTHLELLKAWMFGQLLVSGVDSLVMKSIRGVTCRFSLQTAYSFFLVKDNFGPFQDSVY